MADRRRRQASLSDTELSESEVQAQQQPAKNPPDSKDYAEEVAVVENEGDEGSEYETDEDADGEWEEERQSGDGEEQPDPDGELDDDEDVKNPAYIPRKGAFYEHDSRSVAEEAPAKPEEIRPVKKLWAEKERWGHDCFDESRQAPKSREELIALYGYDIRAGDKPPDEPPKSIGRGSRGGSRRNANLGDYFENQQGRGRTFRGRGRSRPLGQRYSDRDGQEGGYRQNQNNRSYENQRNDARNEEYREEEAQQPRNQVEAHAPPRNVQREVNTTKHQRPAQIPQTREQPVAANAALPAASLTESPTYSRQDKRQTGPSNTPILSAPLPQREEVKPKRYSSQRQRAEPVTDQQDVRQHNSAHPGPLQGQAPQSSAHLQRGQQLSRPQNPVPVPSQYLPQPPAAIYNVVPPVVAVRPPILPSYAPGAMPAVVNPSGMVPAVVGNPAMLSAVSGAPPMVAGAPNILNYGQPIVQHQFHTPPRSTASTMLSSPTINEGYTIGGAVYYPPNPNVVPGMPPYYTSTPQHDPTPIRQDIVYYNANMQTGSQGSTPSRRTKNVLPIVNPEELKGNGSNKDEDTEPGSKSDESQSLLYVTCSTDLSTDAKDDERYDEDNSQNHIPSPEQMDKLIAQMGETIENLHIDQRNCAEAIAHLDNTRVNSQHVGDTSCDDSTINEETSLLTHDQQSPPSDTKSQDQPEVGTAV